ncbi:hypothetical protein BH09BAC5_BH09BAC5_10660 [soil metagenome]
MKRIKHLLLLLILCSITARAIPPLPPDFRIKKYGFSFAGSGVISFFKVDTRHSEAAKMRPGMGGIFRLEFYPAPNIHLQFGLEMLSQGCRFNTYYFAPGYSTLYDRSFGYTHTLRTLELYLPVIVRIGLKPMENDARTIFYFLAGYSPKLFLSSNTSITQNETGKSIWDGSTELDYEYQFLGAQTGNVMIGGIGLDKRIRFEEKFISYELIFRYNLSRFNYHGRIGIDNTNDLLMKNCCINFQVGYRFQ